MLSHADFMANVRRLPGVEMDVTWACNNRCTICGTGWTNRAATPPDPTRDALRDRMRAAFELGARRLTLKGGEPTLRSDLGGIVEDARKIGFRHVFVFTNARLAAGEEGARRLTSFGASGFHVSVQGGTARAHDAAVQADGAFRQTTAGLRRLVEAGELVLVNSVLTSHLVATLEEHAALLAEIRPSEVGFDTVKPGGRLVETQLGRVAARLGLHPHRRPGETVEFGELSPKLSSFSARLAAAIDALRAAGIPTFLSSFPPCLLPPGRETLASGTEDAATLISGRGPAPVKRKKDLLDRLRAKGDACRSCALDDSCPGVWRAYARAHGLAELRPLATRPSGPGPAPSPAPAEEADLERALRQALVAGPAPLAGRIEARAGGRFHLFHGGLEVVLDPDLAAPAYRRTPLFSVSYVGESASQSDLAAVDAIAARLTERAPSLALLASRPEPGRPSASGKPPTPGESSEGREDS